MNIWKRNPWEELRRELKKRPNLEYKIERSGFSAYTTEPWIGTITKRGEKRDIPIDHLTIQGTVRNGEVVLTEIAISADNISSDTLRAVPVGPLRLQIARDLKDSAKYGDPFDIRSWFLYNTGREDDPDMADLAAEAAAAEDGAKSLNRQIRSTGRPGGGRPPLTDKHLRNVAETYLKLFPTRPNDIRVAVADDYRLQSEWGASLKDDRVFGWIHRSRKAGWLAETTPGSPNAEPGPRLLEWWDEHGYPDWWSTTDLGSTS
jgi:hypothetical protein